jgi:hypothetical protein
MVSKTTEAAYMIRRDKALQDIVCFLSDGEILSSHASESGHPASSQAAANSACW